MPRTTITLGTALGLNECVAGLNTLSITVVAADGSRLTRTATFIAEAPAKLVPPKRGERDRPVVLPPRATPVEPVRLKPRVAKTPLDAGARKTLSVAAKDAVMARKANPADRARRRIGELLKTDCSRATGQACRSFRPPEGARELVTMSGPEAGQ